MGTSDRQAGYYDNIGPAVLDAWLRGFGSKRVWFTDAEVKANTKSVETRRY